jgi:4-amino-4-deoxy-L-arabinose transferase-like glycosyltransferase
MKGTPIKRRWHALMLIGLALFMALPGLSRLPVIDRDEARFSQASLQMAESGDLLNIRFQDEARNKKPAGAYWAQTVMLKLFSDPKERDIWAHRLPSVLAAMMTLLATYWGGLRMIGRDGAFWAAGLLGISIIFVFEAHIAKTDALLCASTTLAFAALARLRNGGGRREVWIFWIALGASILIKGPIGPALAILSLLGLWLWERDLGWAKPLFNLGAMCLFLLLWVPWAVAIFIATDGAFFAESLGNDFGGKIVSAQESHPGPPGYHLGLILLTLWPASLFLLPGVAYAVATVRRGGDSTVSRAMRLCVVWVVPFWVLIELMPTKLPHYALPLFPMICLTMGAAVTAMLQVEAFQKTRRIGAALFGIASLGLVVGLLFVQSFYGETKVDISAYVIVGMGGFSALIAMLTFWGGRIRAALFSAGVAGVVLTLGSYMLLLPSLESFRTPERLAADLRTFAPNVPVSRVHSPQFTEPSLVYYFGKEINLDGDAAPNFTNADVIVFDRLRKETAEMLLALAAQAKASDSCIAQSDNVDGFNYSEGDAVSLFAVRLIPCPSTD